MKVRSIIENFGPVGTIVSAMGCASCFPVLGMFGASLGLGFLANFEGIIINTLLPIFAVITLISVVMSWTIHKQLLRGVLGVTSPIMILATWYLFWTNNWSTYMFYFALALMLVMSIWNFISPQRKTCQIQAANSECSS